MTFKKLLQPYVGRLFLLTVSIVVANLLAMVLPWGIKVIVDDVLIRQNDTFLIFIIGVLFFATICRSVIFYYSRYSSSMLGEQLTCDLRNKIHTHIHRLSIKSLKKIQPSQILTRFTGDIDHLRKFLFGDAVEFFYGILSIILITVLLCYINIRLTGIAIIFLPFFAVVYLRMLPQLKQHHQHIRDVWGRLSSRFNEVLQGIRVVRTFSTRNYEQGLFEDRQRELLKRSSKAHSLNIKLWIMVELFSSLGIITVLGFGCRDVIQLRMSAGELVAFYSYLGMLFAPVIRMVVIMNSYQEASAALERINDLFIAEPGFLKSTAEKTMGIIQGEIEFRNVNFEYSTGSPVLKDISFKINKGEHIGIVGESGAGKTTLMNLLMLFYQPNSGTIFIDGQDLSRLDKDHYLRHLAVVLQDDFLFSGSIRENIRYGSFQATDQQVKQVAKLAQADMFIGRLPNGYDTQIGERGVNLSGGQRQRIAIARALLTNPTVLILDEATSSIDALTENVIQNDIEKFMGGKTIITVAHRFSTIINADRIIVFNKGQIVEMGHHNNLLKREGIYSNLYFEQFKSASEDLTTP